MGIQSVSLHLLDILSFIFRYIVKIYIALLLHNQLGKKKILRELELNNMSQILISLLLYLKEPQQILKKNFFKRQKNVLNHKANLRLKTIYNLA